MSQIGQDDESRKGLKPLRRDDVSGNPLSRMFRV